MQSEIDYLGRIIDVMESNTNTNEIMRFHNELKIFTPVGVSETDCDVMWYKAWRSCPADLIGAPDIDTIRKCCIIFCKMLMKRIQ